MIRLHFNFPVHHSSFSPCHFPLIDRSIIVDSECDDDGKGEREMGGCERETLREGWIGGERERECEISTVSAMLLESAG